MAHMKLLSWNVRGLNDKVKRSLVLTYLKKYNPHVCILQETHLAGSKVLGLKKPWACHYYHATYSSFAQGVSVLIHKSLTYELLDVKVDPEGSYVLLHVVIDTMEMIILGLYIPPPATTALLKFLIPLLSMYPTRGITRNDRAP